MVGSSGIPIEYTLRKVDIPPEDQEYPSNRDYIIANSPLEGGNFERDKV